MARPEARRDARTGTIGAATLPHAGRHAVVTGGGGGIGAAIAEELARLGASLTLIGRDGARLEATAAGIAARHGVAAQGALADVADGASLTRAIEAAAKGFGPPAILINNAGAAESAPFQRLDEAHWQRMIAVNLTGTYHGCRAALPLMLEAGFGRIVNIASTAGLTGYPYVAAYCAAKHGVIGLTRALALEVARKNVTVNALCPGFAETDMTERSIANIMEKTGRDKDAATAELARHNPQGRLVRPEEVAVAAAFLTLPQAAAVNGQAIAVDGGEVMA